MLSRLVIVWGIVVPLLIPALASGQTTREIEDLFWRSVECKSARQVQAYLQEFPEGRYVAEARACLEQQRLQEAREIEAVFWRSVECKSRLQVQIYLEEFPAGRYLAEAWACLEGQLGLDRAARVVVQQGLATVGHDPGPADGLFGGAQTRTRLAIRAWQAAKGMAETGYLTREQADTLMAVGQEAEEAEQRQQAEARRQAQAEAKRKRAAEVERQAREREAERRRKEEAERQQQAQEAAARAEAARQRQTCEGRSEGAECWIELSGRPGCYVFIFNFKPSDRTAWTGECADGLAHGTGTLTFTGDGYKDEYTGLIQNGKRHGHFIIRNTKGDVWEGPYVNGKMHGHFIIRNTKGDVWEGLYVDGELQDYELQD